jgi:hypothetical protein
MKLKILGEHYAEAVVDLIAFKDDLPKEWDIIKAIKLNTKVVQNKLEQVTSNEIKEMICNALDWQGILEVLKDDHVPNMHIRFYPIKYTDRKKLYPGSYNKKEKEFTFIEECTSKNGTLLVQSLVLNRNFDLKAFIKHDCYRYASTDKEKFIWGNKNE